jgi:hypothetical protein
MRHLALISGFPGCGKTTFMQWLASQESYLFVDMERGGIDRDGLREVWDAFYNGSDRATFVARLLARSSKIVLDWNFPPNVYCLEVVRALQDRGFEVWWFEGDRLAARKRFLERGTESVDNFDRHAGEICSSWQLIEPIVASNVIRTIDADGNFLPHEAIFQRFTRLPG